MSIICSLNKLRRLFWVQDRSLLLACYNIGTLIVLRSLLLISEILWLLLFGAWWTLLSVLWAFACFLESPSIFQHYFCMTLVGVMSLTINLLVRHAYIIDTMCSISILMGIYMLYAIIIYTNYYCRIFLASSIHYEGDWALEYYKLVVILNM